MFINSSHGPIYYEIHGHKNADAVAFFHGMFADHKMFERQISEFKDDYRLILWDMPEHGQSVRLEKEFSFSVAAACFIELLDEICVEKAVLVGVSMGGYLSQYLAGKYPDRVKAVAVEGSHPLHARLSKPFYFGLMLGFSIFKLMFKILPLTMIRSYFVKMTPGDEQKKYLENIFIQLDKKRMLLIYEGLRKKILKGIEEPGQQPVLITHGEHETPLIRKMCEKWHKSNSQSEYVVISGAGHDAMFTNPEEYNKALRSFLSRLK